MRQATWRWLLAVVLASAALSAATAGCGLRGTPTPVPPATTSVDARVAFAARLHGTATIKLAEDRPAPASPPLLIRDPRIVAEIVSLLLEAEPVAGINSLPTTHTLTLYESGGEERSAASITATPARLRALGELRPGELAAIRYDLASNRFYYHPGPVPEAFWGFSVAPAALRDLLSAQLSPATAAPTSVRTATPPPSPTPAPAPQTRTWGGYEIRMAISARDPRLCDVSVRQAQTGALQLSLAVPDVYLLHYHAAEFYNGRLYIIRRIGYDGYPDEDWTDELWRYDAQGQATRLYAAQGLDFRVAPGERAIAIAISRAPSKGRSTLVFLDPSGRPTQELPVERLSGQEPGALRSAYVSPYGWAGDGRAFWATVMRGPFEYEFARVDVGSWQVTAYDVATLPMGDFALNPNTGLLVYSNAPIRLAVDPGETFWEGRRQVTLFVRDLAAQRSRPVAASVAKAFHPRWLDDATLEVDNPAGEGRVARGIAPAAPGRELTGLQMADAVQGWATGVGSIQRTTDGGAHWQDVTPADATGVAIESLGGAPVNVAFWGAQAAWLAVPQRQGKIVLFRTGDGGRAWQSATVDTSGAEGRAVPWKPQVLALTFADAQHGWLLASLSGGNAGLQDAVVYRTDDGGGTWALVAAGYKPVGREAGPVPASGLPFTGAKFGLRFVDVQHGWLTGNARADGIWLYASSDGGATWQPQPLANPACCPAAGGAALTQPPLFFGAREGVLPVQFRAQGLSTVFYGTRDGGATWSPAATLPSTVGGGLLWSWLDANRGWASDGARLYATRDGGHTWDQVPAGGAFKGATLLDFVSEQAGWAVCEGQLLRTTDGGRTWQERW